MGNYTILWMFENPRSGRQATNFTTNAPKIQDLKLSSEQIFSRKLPLGAPVGSLTRDLQEGNARIFDLPKRIKSPDFQFAVTAYFNSKIKSYSSYGKSAFHALATCVPSTESTTSYKQAS